MYVEASDRDPDRWGVHILMSHNYVVYMYMYVSLTLCVYVSVFLFVYSSAGHAYLITVYLFKNA